MRETIEDVVKSLRDRAEGRRKSGKLLQIDDKMFDLLADRIEAAHKREVAVAENATTTPTCKDFLQVGNAAQIREALKAFVDYSDLVQRMGIFVRDSLVKITTKARAALAKPPRNCDVGTPQEQIKRWEKFCQEHHERWKPGKSLAAIQRCNCPCHEGNGCNYFIWAQMPYKEVK